MRRPDRPPHLQIRVLLSEKLIRGDFKVTRVLAMMVTVGLLIFATSAMAFAENGPIWPEITMTSGRMAK